MSEEEVERLEDIEEEGILNILKARNKEALERIALRYIKLWRMIDPITRYYIERLNKPFMLMRRDYRPVTGFLTSVEFQPVSYTVVVEDKDYDSISGKYVMRGKEVKINAGMVFATEFIFSEEEVKD